MELLGFLRTVCRSQQRGKVAQAKRHHDVVPAQGYFVDCESVTIERLGLGGTIRAFQQQREIIERGRQFGSVRPIARLVDRQRSTQE